MTSAFLRIAIVAGALALSVLQASAEPQAAGPMRGQASSGTQASHSSPTTGAALEIVVRFRDDGQVKDIIDAFWKDPHAGKAMFDAFKQSRPEMAAASLARVTFSSELVLAYPFKAATKAERLIEARDVAIRLAAAPDISYAEPDLAFQTQG